jgi:XTP/dITP diphosphohydrolase
MTQKLLLATNNRGKIKEYRSLLDGVPLKLVTLAEEGITTVVEETGKTFEENAGLKARIIAAESRLLTFADDSGLEVDALGGEPGVLSARYAGDGVSDADRYIYLLSRMKGIPPEKRSARFRCVIAVAEPDGGTDYFSGECRGMITLEPSGFNGFGYDPVFFVPEYGKTMAELPAEVKNSISHRARAAEKARRMLIERYSR